MNLEETLLALEKPLTYISRNNWANLCKVVGLDKSLTPLLMQLLDTYPQISPTVKRMLNNLKNYDSLSPEEKRIRVTELLADIELIRNPPPTQKVMKRALELLDTPIQFLKGVGPQMAQKLNKLGIWTIEDALYNLPRDYEDRRFIAKIKNLHEGVKATVIGVVTLVGKASNYSRNFEAVITDDTGILYLKWFNVGKWIENKIKKGDRVVVYGTVRRYRTIKEIHHPQLSVIGEDEDSEARGILPIYPSGSGLKQWYLRMVMSRAVEVAAHEVPDVVPSSIQRKLNLMPLKDAFYTLHKPVPDENIEELRENKSEAHKRLVFNELLALEAGLALRKRGITNETAYPINSRGSLIRALVEKLPFELTGAQKRVIRQIQQDMKKSYPMNRLLQGDVGSGKTLVALMGALLVVEAGYQSAFMAPTEILAEQHYRTFTHLLKELNIPVLLLVGKQKPTERKAIIEEIASGKASIVIGTHAVIQESVRFRNLAYAVVDEQHRFGVKQRAELKEKGKTISPHTLVMTATPIPRTLALTVYGDLNLSILDEIPKSRQVVTTKLVSDKGRERVWEEVRRELSAGNRAYIVYPIIEESASHTEIMDATSQWRKLKKEVFPEFQVGLIHGRMKPEKKEKTMLEFASGKIQILVATTVIEVGIDVPEATVMVVEHAERFGLSQLHQLRGRVGRGDKPSTCYFIYQYSRSDNARKRLEIIAQTNDGFTIAEADLEIRGPGEFLGARQSGMPDFRVANIARDESVLIAAKQEAFELIAKDPYLELPQHYALKETLKRLWKGHLALAGVG